LNFFANANAFSAKNALGRVSLDCRAGNVEFAGAFPAIIAASAHTVFFSEVLQVAVAVSYAVKAVIRVIGEKQFDDGFSGSNRHLAVSLAFKPIGNGSGAAGDQAAIDFNDTHSASAAGRQTIYVAESRDFDTGSSYRG